MPHKPQTSIIEYARSIISEEALAISGLLETIDGQFESAVRLVLEMPETNRVIVSGMGKASFVGMKISATFASTGTPSFFLHPAEALHGDLGRFSGNDIAIILSNSGETPEILRILPHVKRLGCKVVSITGLKDSSLATHSDLVLSIGKLDEAGPHGLAPTTSTTAMLAVGDALAMAVFDQRGFSREQFAAYHPGGQLGASLMPVSQVMRSGDEHCLVPCNMKVRDVLHKISTTKGRPGAASIVNPDGTLAGVFTDGDLRRYLEQGNDFLDLEISQVMTSNPRSILADKLAPEALRVLSEKKIDQIIVLDSEKRPVGMVDIQDLVGIGLK